MCKAVVAKPSSGLNPRLNWQRIYGLRSGGLSIVFQLIEEHQDEITNAWNEHFGT